MCFKSIRVAHGRIQYYVFVSIFFVAQYSKIFYLFLISDFFCFVFTIRAVRTRGLQVCFGFRRRCSGWPSAARRRGSPHDDVGRDASRTRHCPGDDGRDGAAVVGRARPV